MTIREEFDVVIVGGGPAGLSVGAELSKGVKVLLIEKANIGDTEKSWLVPYDIAMKNKDVIPYTYDGVTNWSTNTFTGAKIAWKAKLFDRFPYIKEHEILKYWAKVMDDHGSQVLDNCYYIDHTKTNDKVFVKTSKGDFACKLLIDASGSNSQIVQEYEIDQGSYYWWAVYGCVVEHPKGIAHSMKPGEYRFWQTFEDTNIERDASLRSGRPVFEYEVLDEKTSFPLILYLQKTKAPLEFMEKEFFRILKEEETTKEFRDCIVKEKKWGWFPSGGLSQKISQDRVAFIGDAGCWTTPCGWGMAFIMDNYKQYADNLISLIQSDQLDKDSLDQLVDYGTYEKHQILLDQLIVHFLANATATQLDRFIHFFTVLDPIYAEKMFTLRITRDEIIHVIKEFLTHFELKELIKIVPLEDYKLLLQELRYFLGDFIEEIIFRDDVNQNKDGFTFTNF